MLVEWIDLLGFYQSPAYKRLLAEYGIGSSMSRKGNCYDNACVESFFASLKNELVAFECFRNSEEAKQKLFIWIETYYNRIRRHFSLGYMSPLEFEEKYA